MNQTKQMLSLMAVTRWTILLRRRNLVMRLAWEGGGFTSWPSRWDPDQPVGVECALCVCIHGRKRNGICRSKEGMGGHWSGQRKGLKTRQELCCSWRLGFVFHSGIGMFHSECSFRKCVCQCGRQMVSRDLYNTSVVLTWGMNPGHHDGEQLVVPNTENNHDI